MTPKLKLKLAISFTADPEVSGKLARIYQLLLRPVDGKNQGKKNERQR